MTGQAVIASAVMLTGLGAPASAHAQPKIAVLPCAAQRVEESVTKILDDLLINQVYELGRYETIGARDIDAMIGLEKMKEAVGCEDVACAADIGGALGVSELLTCAVSRLGGELMVSLTLVDIRKSAVAGRSQVRAPDRETEYARAVVDAVAKLWNLESRVATPTTTPAARESGSTGNDTYDDNYLWFEDMAAVTSSGAVVARWSDIVQGKYKKEVDIPEFYRLVGQGARAAAWESRVRAARWSYVAAGVFAAVGLGAAVYGVYSRPDEESRSVRYCNQPEGGRCDTWLPDILVEKSGDDNSTTWYIVGGVSAGMAVAATIAALVLSPSRADPADERRWVEEYNKRLKKSSAAVEHEPTSRVSVLPWVEPGTGGIAATVSW